MRLKFLFCLLLLVAIGVYGFVHVFSLHKTQTTQNSSVAPAPLSVYHQTVQPVFNNRCVACHSCYNSPCQLNLGSFEGLNRGLHSTKKVYDSKRSQSITPTRLFTDTKHLNEWRAHGFISVIEKSDDNEKSILERVLDEKSTETEFRRSQLDPAEESHACYSDKKIVPMPFGVSAINSNEQNAISAWFAAGAPEPSRDELKALSMPSEKNLEQISEWESYLNRQGDKEQLISRYIYEHLYLGRIYFGTPDELYQIVRSRSPCRSGKTVMVNEIPSRRPFDDPSPYHQYCFRKSIDARVHKSHIPYLLNDKKMKRFRELFESTAYGVWTATRSPSYDIKEASNPFLTFEDIPVKARYQFLLDDAQVFFMNFILGPVCKGNTALNVIEEQFYVMFVDPDSYSTDALNKFYSQNKGFLNLPAMMGSDLGTRSDEEEAEEESKVAKILGIVAGLDAGAHNTLTFMGGVNNFAEAVSKLKDGSPPESGLLKDRIDFREKRAEFYKSTHANGYGVEDIWDGDGENENALLTVFRHYNSATVLKGAVGPMTKTLWVLDYGLFESIFYNLVAGFDVFGDAGHQLSTRYYMGQQRLDGEEHFLLFMPQNYRAEMRDYWYRRGVGVLSHQFPIEKRMKLWYPPELLKHGSGVVKGNIKKPTLEDLNSAKKKVFEKIYEARFEKLFGEYKEYPKAVESFLKLSESKGMDYVQQFPDMSLIRVEGFDANSIDDDRVFSLIRNKEHFNVWFVFFEDDRREKLEDSLYVVPGFVGSYPMQFFDVPYGRLNDFIADMKEISSKSQYESFLRKFGVNQNSKEFWPFYDFLTEKFRRMSPVEAGLMDLNRYGNLYD